MRLKKLGPWPIVIVIAVVILILYETMVRRSTEGFAAGQTPQCPTGYKFFVDARGESMCCAGGEIDRYKHVCTNSSPLGKCSLKKDKNSIWCGDLIAKKAAEASTNLCPKSMPHYATIGKCCATATDLDGYDCSDADKSQASSFCSASGSGSGSCAQRKMEEGAFCPQGMAKIPYTMGPKETAKYGAAASGKTIPVCFSMEGTCIPDNVIREVQKDGIYREKTDMASWLYACTGWDRVKNKRDLTGKIDSSYI
jgi:hypothetical protein